MSVFVFSESSLLVWSQSPTLERLPQRKSRQGGGMGFPLHIVHGNPSKEHTYPSSGLRGGSFGASLPSQSVFSLL